MKKNGNKVISIAAVCLFGLVILLLWIFGIAGLDTAPDSGEIRRLAVFPTEYSDDYLVKVNEFVNDHSPMRNSMISAVNSIDRSFKKIYEERINAPIYRFISNINATPAPTATPYVTLAPDQTPSPSPEPTPTPDFSGLFGDETERPTEEGSTPDPLTTSVPSCPHEFGETYVLKEPDCVNEGRGTRACLICGTVETVIIPATGHKYLPIRSQAASYAHDGYTLKKCRVCLSTTVDDIVLRTSVPGFYDDKRPITYSGSGFRGLHDWYFYTGNNSIGYFQGDNVLTESECKEWTDTFETLHRECEKRGITLVYLVAPNKEQVYPEYMPDGLAIVEDSQKREPQYLEYLEKRNSPIRYLYPLRQLKTAKILYETFYQQDTHWNSVGGFIGAMQVYSAIGMPVTGLQDVSVSLYERSGGDLVNLGVGEATEYAEYSVSYKPEITVRTTALYSNTVVGNNETPNSELRIMESDSPNDKKCVIVGDSFRHSLGSFIAKDFRKVTLTHRADFNTVSNLVQLEDGTVTESGETVLQDALRELGEGDLLIIMAVERADSENVWIAGTIASFYAGLRG